MLRALRVKMESWAKVARPFERLGSKAYVAAVKAGGGKHNSCVDQEVE